MPDSFKTTTYSPLKKTGSKSDEHLDSSNGEPLPSLFSTGNARECVERESPSLTIVTLVNFFIFGSSVILFYFASVRAISIENNTSNRLVRSTSSYSPIFSKLPITLTTQKANGSFWPQNPPSIYQLPPSPEVDKSWARLSDTHVIALTESEIKKLGQDPNTVYPFPSSYEIPGHPKDHSGKLYMALPNVFHQIHCLNMFRKLAHVSYYGEFWTHTLDFPLQEHVGHCQYMLLQTLMCHSDLEVITFNKVKGTPGPFPDFSVEKKCRNFDDVLKWKESNQINVSDEKWKEISKTPQGIEELEPEGLTLPAL